MKKINTDLKYLSAIWIITILAIIATVFHHGHVLVDCGREVYYPTQILLGKVLYKDIFNIYGPFSYMFNAFLYKLFGIHLNLLYIMGCACAFSVVTLIYLISRTFLSGFLSFAIAVFTISIGVLNLHLFNFIFPYSYAVLYGLVGFLASFWLLLKYQSNPEKTIYLYLGSFFAGLCIVSKYEFLPYFLVVFYSMIRVKPLKFVQYYYSFLSLFALPVFCFGILFLHGLRMHDLLSTFEILNKMAHSRTLKYFYQNQGVYFSTKTVLFLLGTFFTTSLTLFGFAWAFMTKNKILSVLLIVALGFFMTKMQVVTSLAFVSFLIFVFAGLNFKNLKNDFPLQILTLSALLLSLKVFSGLLLVNYGMFFASFLLIALLALIVDRFKTEENSQIPIGIYVLILAVLIGNYNLSFLGKKSELIKTDKGKIYSSKELAPAANELIDYIEKNTKMTDSVVIFPEGLFINFLTGRKSDDYYNSLIPLYVESIGEDRLIEHFSKTKPEYIVFDNWDNSDYYFKYICTDYAVSFCNFVASTYKQRKIIDKNGFRYLIFKKK